MRKYLILGGIIVITGIVVNFTLGGFEPIEPVLISAHKTRLYGWHYEGYHASDSLDRQVEKLRDILAATGQPGTLTIVNYLQPELEKRGVVKQFVGIDWGNTSYTNDYKLDTLSIAAYNGFQFVISIKPLVMPSPEKLKRMAREAAKNMDAQLQDISIEQYKNKTLIVNFPLN